MLSYGSLVLYNISRSTDKLKLFIFFLLTNNWYTFVRKDPEPIEVLPAVTRASGVLQMEGVLLQDFHHQQLVGQTHAVARALHQA